MPPKKQYLIIASERRHTHSKSKIFLNSQPVFLKKNKSWNFLTSFLVTFLMLQLADPSENDTTMIAPLLGYAKQGVAEGKPLYVNYGRKEDFQVLKQNFGITNCSGYIVIMRYGRRLRGDMVRIAIKIFDTIIITKSI